MTLAPELIDDLDGPARTIAQHLDDRIDALEVNTLGTLEAEASRLAAMSLFAALSTATTPEERIEVYNAVLAAVTPEPTP